MEAQSPMSTVALNSMGRATTILWILVISAVAFALRFSVLDRTNLDIAIYSLPWLEQLRDLGFWRAIAHPFSEGSYPPFYTYAMGVADLLLPTGTDGKSVMKAIPIFFDFMAAGLTFAVAGLRWGANWQRIAAYASILFAPTIVLNGAYWGQSDIVYSSFLVASILSLLKRVDIWAMICFGIALAIKLQAIWFAPFILLMLMHGRIRWQLIFLPPLIYFILTIPTLLAGRSVVEVMTIYLTQVETQTRLSYWAPNIQFLIGYVAEKQSWPIELTQMLAKASIAFVICLSVYYARTFAKGRMTDEALIIAAVVSILMVVQFLPHMHERYFFTADVLMIVLAVWRPAYWSAAALMQLNSFVSYIGFLWGDVLREAELPAALMFFGLTHNIQWVRILVAVAGISNLFLLLWFWRRLHTLQTEVVHKDR